MKQQTFSSDSDWKYLKAAFVGHREVFWGENAILTSTLFFTQGLITELIICFAPNTGESDGSPTAEITFDSKRRTYSFEVSDGNPTALEGVLLEKRVLQLFKNP
jgi:hypothetical protein